MTLPAVPGPEPAEPALDRVTGSRAIPGNRVELLTDGPEIFDQALELIEGATRWIHVDNYIIRDDRTGNRFARSLGAKAREGVRVRVMADWFGSAGAPREYWERLRRDGVEARRFNPIRLHDPLGSMARNHRKLFVADGRIAITGGFCLADEWAGDPDRGRQPWRETGLLVEGPAAAVMDQAFGDAWGRAGRPLAADELASQIPAAGSAAVRVIAGVPGRDRVFRTMDLVLAGSRDRFWVTDAYFMAPRRLYQALLDAAAQGVDIRLLVPGSSDVPWVRNLTRFGYRRLLEGGVRIFEWNGPMLHAKCVVADGRWVRIGSSNLNPSSLYGNWELDVLVEDARLAGAVEARFRRDLEQSSEVSLTAPGKSGLAILRPGFDVRHLPGLRERGRRGVLMLRTLLGAARLATFGPVAVVLAALAALVLVTPRTMAVGFGLLAVWAALAALAHAVRRRGEGGGG